MTRLPDVVRTLRRRGVPGFVVARCCLPVLLAVGMWGCKRQGDRGPSGSVSPGSLAGANVLLITLDTTRPDRVGCYGHAAARTPALDRLARRGVLFERVLAHTPITLPSHVTLMTGAYPPEHGVFDNGATALGSELSTLAELFAGRGYRTGAFVGSFVLDRRYGLDRGFATYDDEMGAVAPGANRFHAERRGDVVTDRALAWLEADRPFFCWVHYYDPHDPYIPPPAYRSASTHPYDGEIAFVDSQIQRLVAWVDKKGLNSRTLFVAVGDHGEAFGEHGEANSHMLLLYEVNLAVPLILSAPGSLPQGMRVPGTVGLVDLYPTFVEMFGLDGPSSGSGRSLLPAIREGVVETRGYYAESRYGLINFGWAPLRSLSKGNLTYIDAPQPELYDLARDPGQWADLATQRADLVRQMGEELRQMMASMTPRRGKSIHQSVEDLNKLQSLGYLAAQSPAGEETEARPDPKAMLDVYAAVGDASMLLRQGRPEEAVAALEPVVSRSPRSLAIRGQLATAYKNAGRLEDAERTILQALEIKRDVPDLHLMLAEVLFKTRRAEEAIPHCRLAVDLDPQNRPARLALAELYVATRRLDKAAAATKELIAQAPDWAHAHAYLGQIQQFNGAPDAALDAYRRALEIDPDNTDAHRGIAVILQNRGDLAGAIGSYQELLRVDPNRYPARYNLALLLAANDQANEAIDHYEIFLKAFPDHAPAHNDLAISLERVGKPDDAVAHLRRALEIDPNFIKAYLNLGNVALEEGRMEEAAGHFADALEKDAENATAHYGLGVALVRLERIDEALPHLREALRLNPQFAAAQKEIDQVMDARAELEEATPVEQGSP